MKEGQRNKDAELIKKSNFSKALADNNMDEWIQVMTSVCDGVAPMKTFTVKPEDNHIPWFNNTIIDLKSQKGVSGPLPSNT